MGGPAFELQKAIYTVLSGDATLLGLATGGVFDCPQEDTSFPYVTIGDDTLADWSSKTFDGKEATITIHSWSEAMGREEVKKIMDRIDTLLHNGSLSMTGHSLVVMQFDFAETLRDPDGRTYHGVQRFRALTKEA